MFYDYVESGSWTETTLHNNTNDFQKIIFRQRVAVDISNRKTSVDILGKSSTMPCAIAPLGLLGMQYADAISNADGEVSERFKALIKIVPNGLIQFEIKSLPNCS